MSKFLNPGETVIVSETDVTGGGLKANDAYDLHLIKDLNGKLTLVVFMKLQFFFENSGTLMWTTIEKDNFIKDFLDAVKKAWGNGTILRTLPDSTHIWLAYRFETQIGGWMFDHWELTVKKVSGFAVSKVNLFWGNVTLDSFDLNPTQKNGAPPGLTQRGGVHEFGHMLGLDDEYLKGSYTSVYDSVMNRGELNYPRHRQYFNDWLDKKYINK